MLLHARRCGGTGSRVRRACPYPEVFWDSELRAEGEQWKGTAACVAIGFLFALTLGLIYWQVVDQPHLHWMVPGRFSGLFWDSGRSSLVFRTLSEDSPVLDVSVGPVGDADSHLHFWGSHRNRCRPDSSRFCTEWEGQLAVGVGVELDEEMEVECYNISWTPLNCRLHIKHCFSMESVWWYGGGSVRPQRWPINPVNVPLQPFTPTDSTHHPSGYGSVLEHQLYGSSGVAVLLSPDVLLNVGIERDHQVCVEPRRAQPLHYRVCVGHNLKAVHQKIAHDRRDREHKNGQKNKNGPNNVTIVKVLFYDTVFFPCLFRTSGVPLFVRMAPLQHSWSYTGIRGIIPAVLHYSLLGYNFFIPDAVGGSLTDDLITDEELFIRWLQIISFLPVMSFQTPPWSFSQTVLNLTLLMTKCLKFAFVVPLVLKFTEEWRRTQNPIYRPLWWISPEDPITFTIDDQFLIGSEVLVAPVTEEGARNRNIYLPGVGVQWRDGWNRQVFDGGTFLHNFPVALDKVAFFQRIQS
uniref:Glycosyl hydrolase family 31 C-terminal domain-containing protein n=1 Tax=Astyanax mexicanus TaxID=7994 RepID=A0A3B1JYS8_ASTMX